MALNMPLTRSALSDLRWGLARSLPAQRGASAGEAGCPGVLAMTGRWYGGEPGIGMDGVAPEAPATNNSGQESSDDSCIYRYAGGVGWAG